MVEPILDVVGSSHGTGVLSWDWWHGVVSRIRSGVKSVDLGGLVGTGAFPWCAQKGAGFVLNVAALHRSSCVTESRHSPHT